MSHLKLIKLVLVRGSDGSSMMMFVYPCGLLAQQRWKQSIHMPKAFVTDGTDF